MIKFKVFIKNLIRAAFRQISYIEWEKKIITKNQVDYVLVLNQIYNEVKEVPGHNEQYIISEYTNNNKN